MNALRIVLTIVMIAISVIITVIILMQEGKDQGLGAISGAAETFDFWIVLSYFSQNMTFLPKQRVNLLLKYAIFFM